MSHSLTKRLALSLAVIGLSVGGYAVYTNTQSIAEEPLAEEMPTEEIQVAQGAPQAMPVQVATMKEETISIWRTFSGRMEAVDIAEVRPRVTGVITEVRFQDGERVAAGDVLYVIDPRPFEAALAQERAQQRATETIVAQARAELEAARTTLDFAEIELTRAEGLIGSNTIAQRTYDERKNAVDVARANEVAARAAVTVAQANVAAAEASVSEAELNLDYAYVKAPISGRVSRPEITLGNMISAGTSPILTTIVSDDGIYAGFNVDERTYLDQVHQFARTNEQEAEIPVRLVIRDGAEIIPGFIKAFDNQIDATSGTIRARAFFPNEDQALVPGMFVEVQMASSQDANRILVSERAIGTNQDRKFVYVISAESTVEVRVITLGDSVDSRRIVTSGLNAGDVVITEGIVRLRPGMPVVPMPEESAS